MATDSVKNNVSGINSLNIENKQAVKSKEMGQDVFLQLMIAQLKNQDPTTPTDSQDFLQQLATFNTVTGITGLQKSVDTLTTSLQSSQALQASTLVGRDVLMSADAMKVTAGKAQAASVQLTDAVGSLKVQIKNSKGELVRELSIGQQNEGFANFKWDGKDTDGKSVPDGDYTLQAQSVTGGVTTDHDVVLKARVNSVTLPRDGSGPILNLAGNGSMSLDKLKQIL